MLTQYLKNYYSQNGEDGVIDHLFDLLEINDGTMVEFGAWDGKYLSNTFYHYEKRKNFNMILIENELGKFRALEENFKNDKKVTCINVEVQTDPTSEHSLSRLLENNIVGDFQLLSIDVDGPDFKIWCSLDREKYKPKIVIIENDKWIYDSERVVMYDDFDQAGYKLVCVTGNFIFVRKEFYSLLQEEMDKDPDYHYYNCTHVDLELYLNRITKKEYDEALKQNRTWVLRNTTEETVK